MNDMNDLERQREHFNSIADTYHTARQGTNHLLLKRLMWEYFAARNPSIFANRKQLTVLEPMCGFADGKKILSICTDANINYEGYDYSNRVVELLKLQQPEAHVWQADATTYSPEAIKYDIILLLGALHHVHKQATECVSKLVPSLKPGGFLISLEPTHGNPIFSAVRKSIYKSNSLFDEITERDFKVSELAGLFKYAGLSQVDVIYPGLLSYILYYNPDAFPKINLGSHRAVRAAFALDKTIISNFLGRTLSFATLSAWQKPD